ncbi:MAG: hypothetical protein WBP56_22325 [Polyangia bacterium]|jgi:hypothetical protein
MRLLRWFVLIVVVAVASSCHRRPASEEDCKNVLNRLIELELNESGYRDAVLRARWQQELGHRFAPDLKRCRGLEVRNDLHACLATAQSSEEITHRCLK